MYAEISRLTNELSNSTRSEFDIIIKNNKNGLFTQLIKDIKFLNKIGGKKLES